MSPRKSKLDLITDRIYTGMLWLIGGIVALVPLWVPTFVFIGISFNKATLFYTLVTILILLYLILIWRDKSYLPKFNFVGWSFLGLVAALGLTTITSIQPYVSFWGTFNRTDGFLMWLYYLVFFVIITSVVVTRSVWWRVISISLVGTVGVVLYGLGQAVLWPGMVASSDRWRIGSTLDNPVFLGGYLALALPLTLSWALTRLDRRWRYAGLVLALLEIVTLVLTWSRGAWLAAIIGGFVFTISYLYWFHRTSAIRVAVAVVVGLGLLLGGLWAGQMLPDQSNWHKASDYLSRTDSISLRYQLWRVAGQAIAERPWLGWGLENFSVAVDKYYQAFSNINVPFSETHTDRPHNEYLGMAINGGIFALLAYLSLWLVAIWLGYRQMMKLVRQRKTFAESIFYLGCLATVVTYMVFAFAAFKLVDIIPYLLLALAGLGQIFWETSTKRHKLNFNWDKPVSLIIGIGMIGLSYWSVIQPVIAVRWADQGTITFQQQKFSDSWRLFGKALAEESYLSNAIRGQMAVLADNARANWENDPVFNDFQRQTGELIIQNYQTEPFNSYYYLIFGMYYGHLAQVWPEYLNKSETSFQRVAELAPRKAETYWQWGNIYGQMGEIDKAKVKYDIALDLEPANWVINYQVGKWYLAVKGDLDQGYVLIQKALADGFMPRFSDVKLVTQFLEEKGQLKQVEQIYQTLIAHGADYYDLALAQTELAEFYQLHPEFL